MFPLAYDLRVDETPPVTKLTVAKKSVAAPKVIVSGVSEPAEGTSPIPERTAATLVLNAIPQEVFDTLSSPSANCAPSA